MKTLPYFFLFGMTAMLACEPTDKSEASDTATETGSTSESGTGSSSGMLTTTSPAATTDDTTVASTGTGSDGETELPETSSDSDTDDTDDTDEAPMCGNGIVDEGEDCDDGLLSENGPCVTGCLTNICGDGFVYTGVEICDAGPQNGIYAGTCSEGCTTENIPHCGDGILQDSHETCEVGEVNNDGVVCNADHCQWGDSRYMFVSSETVPGSLASDLIPDNMTGLARADTLCQLLAVGAGLPGSYYAWLSDNNNTPGYSDAADRIGGPQDGEDVLYVMPQGGVVLAHGWAELVANGPAEAIVRTETGDVVEPNPSRVWTNTSLAGTSLGEFACDNWSTDESFGSLGSTTTGVQWTNYDVDACDNTTVHIYCIEGQAK